MMFSHTRACWSASRCIAAAAGCMTQCQATAAARRSSTGYCSMEELYLPAQAAPYSGSVTQYWA